MELGLADKRCIWPCDATTRAFDRVQAEEIVNRDLCAEWRVCALVNPSEGSIAAPIQNSTLRLERRLAVPDFTTAARLAQVLALVADSEGHYPDITFGWQYLLVRSGM